MDPSVVAAITELPKAKVATLQKRYRELFGEESKSSNKQFLFRRIAWRLQANAEQLVRIRPIGEAPGDGPRAIVARADANAAHGDIAGAMAELDRLPDAMKAPAAAWMRRAAARETAVAAARQLAAQTLAALGKPSP